MTTLLVSHPAYTRHETPRGHPERIDRILAVEQTLADPAFDDLLRLEAPEAPLEAIIRCHPRAHVEALRRLNPHDDEGFVAIDSDTAMSPGTFAAALHAAGGAMLAVDTVMAGRAKNAFSASRPPGHHAEPARAMGFCFFNNAAIAARHAQAAHGLERVAIMDFDVHHGNGTQAIFWTDPSVLYASTHEMPLYPGTGARSETGEAGTIVNAPLRAGDGGEAFRAAMEAVVLPRLLAFAPDLVIVSAGFDAHRRDPLANLNLVEADYAWATEQLMAAAEKTARGRLVSVLEGGYDLTALAGSTAVHVGTLMDG
ncbi:histone deacetylase family protein [Labrys wisconsinensis]|uniref:Acetoin utilization deacetylase AcuC-like enzyme n=1 Tax=Labrys wisconsinensis TaxID=425677 RepID=A0ABU0JBG1_9HYPH|nr:histone deacetylase family protein [Labrys wisconsinensis]MDQ0470609.1 acetoin utilization deacetylase AcuC-like enzyme [Labrys wisconsinensis]